MRATHRIQAVLVLLGLLTAPPLPAEPPVYETLILGIERLKETWMELRCENSLDREIAIRSDISRLEQDQFVGFPASGALQFRDKDRHLLANRPGMDWFYPGLLNSVLNQPVFRVRNGPEPFPPEPPLLKLAPREARKVYFDCAQALQLIRADPKLVDAVEFRVRLEVTIGKSRRQVVSAWIQVP